MVKIELSYNPYVKETIIKFNGQSPKINSLVEKYQDEKLNTWIDKIPAIFKDEMNGYDFELEYSGVKSDFEMLKKAFADAGVKEDEVKILYKNELESASIKMENLYQLIWWLINNCNRRFDIVSFIDNNRKLLTEPFEYIVINGNGLDITEIDKYKIAVKFVESAKELKNISVDNTPILFCIDTEFDFRDSLQCIMECVGVHEKQLFFRIHPILNRIQTERIIRDLGVNTPQIVTSITDDKIMEYFDIYPVSEFVKNTLDILRNEAKKISDILDIENKESRVTNEKIHKQIDNLEEEISRLNDVEKEILWLQNHGPLYPPSIYSAKKTFENNVKKWRKKKNKVTKIEEANKFADELELNSKMYFETYLSDIKNACEQKSTSIKTKFEKLYELSEINTKYDSTNIEKDDLPSLKEELMELKEEKYKTTNEIFGAFLPDAKKKLQEPVLEVTYDFEKWRDKVIDIYRDELNKVVADYFDCVKKYYADLTYEYIAQIKALKIKKNKEKEDIIEQLSSSEKSLQNDNEWLEKLQKKIRSIERD